MISMFPLLWSSPYFLATVLATVVVLWFFFPPWATDWLEFLRVHLYSNRRRVRLVSQSSWNKESVTNVFNEDEAVDVDESYVKYVLALGTANMEGYLWKKGNKFKMWKRYYFTLDENATLQFFASVEDSRSNLSPKGLMTVNSSCSVLDYTSHRPFGLRTYGRLGKMYYLAADDVSMQQKWLLVLKRRAKQGTVPGKIPNWVYEEDNMNLIYNTEGDEQSLPQHRLTVGIQHFIFSKSYMPKISSRHLYLVVKFKSQLHDCSDVPVAQTHVRKIGIKENKKTNERSPHPPSTGGAGGKVAETGTTGTGTAGGAEAGKGLPEATTVKCPEKNKDRGIQWNESFAWVFKDHECSKCRECQNVGLDGGKYSGLPHALVCQIWEVTLLKNVKICTTSVNLLDLMGYVGMESLVTNCSWLATNENQAIVGKLALSFQYTMLYDENEKSSTIPFLTSTEDALKSLVTTEFTNMKPQAFFDQFYKDGAAPDVWSTYEKKRGDTDVERTKWEENVTFGGKTREVTCKSETNAPIGPATTMSTTIQHVTFTNNGEKPKEGGKGENEGNFILKQKITLHDIPYGDCFHVETKIVHTATNEGNVKIEFFIAIPFSKGCLWKSKIMSSTEDVLHKSMNMLYDIMRDSLTTTEPKSETEIQPNVGIPSTSSSRSNSPSPSPSLSPPSAPSAPSAPSPSGSPADVSPTSSLPSSHSSPTRSSRSSPTRSSRSSRSPSPPPAMTSAASTFASASLYLSSSSSANVKKQASVILPKDTKTLSTLSPKSKEDALNDDTNLVALEEIFENQRVSVFGKWGPHHLLPTDRFRYSNRKGDVKLNFDTILPPHGWVWTSNWKIDRNYASCDEEGWSYASDFPRFSSHLKKNKSRNKKFGMSVRRRRWVRTLCNISSHNFQEEMNALITEKTSEFET